MVEANHSSYAAIGDASSKQQVTEHEKSRSRTRLGVTTGQIAMGTPNYNTFKSKMNMDRSSVAGVGVPGSGANLASLNILNQKSHGETGKDSSLSQRAALLNSDSTKENLINMEAKQSGRDLDPLKPQNSNSLGTTLTLKEQTNQDIDKLFGIKFDNVAIQSGNKLHLSPQIGKIPTVDGVGHKKFEFLNSSIGFIGKPDSSNPQANIYKQRSATLEHQLDQNRQSRQRSLPARTSQENKTASIEDISRRSENRIEDFGSGQYGSSKSRTDQRNAATMKGKGTAALKDYRASSFQLNIIQEEDRQQVTSAGGDNTSDKQFLRMGKAANSILNKNGLDMLIINKQSPQGSQAGTGPHNSTNNSDIFTNIRNSQSPYWTSSGGGTVDVDKFSSLAIQENPGASNTGREVTDTENSYGLNSNFTKTKPGTGLPGAANNSLHRSPSQEMVTQKTGHAYLTNPTQQHHRQQSSHTRQQGQDSVLGKHKSYLPFFAAQNVLGSSGASLRTPFRQSLQEPTTLNHQALANGNTGLGGNQGSTVSIRSGGAAAPALTFLEDKRGGNLNFGEGGSKERSQKILDQNSKEVLDYFGTFENKVSPIKPNINEEREKPREPRRDRSL